MKIYVVQRTRFIDIDQQRLSHLGGCLKTLITHANEHLMASSENQNQKIERKFGLRFSGSMP